MDSEREKRKTEYERNQSDFGEVLLNNTYAGRVLKTNGIQIFDMHQANEDFRKIMKLDSINEIAAVYYSHTVDDEFNWHKKEHIVSITKANYWNAFYLPIWTNLKVNERLRVLEWMFESENESRNLGIKQLSYFPMIEDADLANEKINGFFSKELNIIYLNLQDIDNGYACFNYLGTLAHELMHARQFQFAKSYNSNKKADYYTLSQSKLSFYDIDFLKLEYGFDWVVSYALYRTKESEKAADLAALKTIKKFIDINEKQFGIDFNERESFRYRKNELFFNLPEHPKSISSIAEQSYLSTEKIVLKNQSEFLSKLLLLKMFCEEQVDLYDDSINSINDKKDKIKSAYKNGKIDKEEYTKTKKSLEDDLAFYDGKVKSYSEKLAKIKYAFLDTLKEGKISEDFDKSMFDEIKLDDKPQKEYLLPKWLREDEEKFNKQIEDKTFE